MACSEAGSTPTLRMRRSRSRPLKRASMRMRTSPDSTSVALPVLPLPSTVTRMLPRPPAALVHAREQRADTRLELESAPPHHGLGRGEEAIEIIIAEIAATAPCEGRHILGRHCCTIQVLARAHHRAGVQHRADAGLDVVTEQA